MLERSDIEQLTSKILEQMVAKNVAQVPSCDFFLFSPLTRTPTPTLGLTPPTLVLTRKRSQWTHTWDATLSHMQDIGQAIVDSISRSLEGKQLSSFSSLTATVRTAMEQVQRLFSS